MLQSWCTSIELKILLFSNDVVENANITKTIKLKLNDLLFRAFATVGKISGAQNFARFSKRLTTSDTSNKPKHQFKISSYKNFKKTNKGMI